MDDEKTSTLAHLLYNYVGVKELAKVPSLKLPQGFPDWNDFRYPSQLSLDDIRNNYLAGGALVFLDIGAYVRRVRLSKGVSLMTLGNTIGFSDQGIRKLENQTAEKIKLEAKTKIKDMLLKGPFVLTLRVINGRHIGGHNNVSGIHEIRFGLPLELAKTLRGLKDKSIIVHQPLLNIYAYGKSYKFRLNSQQKNNFRKGSLIFLKGNIAFGHAWSVGHGGHRRSPGLVLFKGDYMKSHNNWLMMTNYTFEFNGKELELIED